MSIYDKADKVIGKIKEVVNAIFHNLSTVSNIDKLNIIQVKQRVDTIYKKLKKRNRDWFDDLCEWAFWDGIHEAEEEGFTHKGKYSSDIVDDLLKGYNPVTGYVYDYEVDRKRDRLTESIVASQSLIDCTNAINRAARLWFNQSRTYADLSVDAGRVEAFKRAGVKRVIWVTQDDEKVCEECASRDGVIYEIGSIPPKPHPFCRCYVVPTNKRV